ncbi:hypothetical protein GCM10028784_27880 [Myceligenerans cantabricum]
MRPPQPIPAECLEAARAQEGLVSWAQCRAAGLDQKWVRRLVVRTAWTRVTSGVFDTDPTPVAARRRVDLHDHVRRRAAWVALLAYPDAIGVGQTALIMHGVRGLPRQIVPEVSLRGSRHTSGRGGVVVRQYRGYATYRLVKGGGPGCVVAGPTDAFVQALPGLPRENAVATLSDALHERLISAWDVDAIRTRLRRRRGSAAALRAVGLASALDESPAESFARVSFVDHDVPPDRVQVRFRRGGRVVARCDFAWMLPDGRWLVVEIDGLAPHSSPKALVRDAPRQNSLVGSGNVVMLRFRPSDNDRVGGIGKPVAEQLRDLGWRPGGQVPEGDVDL